ncbi:MAG: hypothetical protein ACLFSQ_06375 [Candidatus Zixiibacteriota bacterium]
MKIAIVDIGTNSVILLAIEADGDSEKLEVQFEQALEPRLGEELHKKQKLNSRAMERTIRAASRLMKSTGWLSIDRVIAFGTHALRYASNSDIFCEKFEKRTGRKVLILSAEEEAQLSCQGALIGLDDVKDFLVVDVGGGSTEISRFSSDGNIEFNSIPIGAVTLTERLDIRQPVSPKKSEEVHNFIREKFGKYLEGIQINTLIGSGGTATSVAMVDLKLSEFDAEKVHGTEIDHYHFSRLSDKFSSKSLSDLRSILFFAPGRADIIAAGCSLYKEIMDITGAKRFLTSQKGVRWGVAKNYKEFIKRIDAL